MLEEPVTPKPEELLLQQAAEDIRQGKFAQARDILTKLLRTDQQNPDYWVWMSAAMETPKERQYCLEAAFKMDPTHAAARRGLVLMGALPPGEDVRPFPMNHPRPWETKLKLDEKQVKASALKNMTSKPGFKLAAIIGAGVLILVSVFIGAGLLAANRPAAPQIAAGTARPTVTPYATNSNQVAQVKSTARPLAELLLTPYTPTPIYAATPHGEAAGDSYKGAMRAYHNGQWDMVSIMMLQVATAQPGSADALYFTGEAKRLSGKFKEALDFYNSAIEVNANFAPSYLGLARATLALDPKKDVSKELSQAIELDPNYAEAYTERGLYFLGRKDLTAARADLEQAASINDSPLVQINLARVLLAQEENEAALQAAQKANQLDVTMLDGYLVLGMAYRANGQIDQAVEILETYLKYKPDNADAFAMLGAAYFNHADYSTAQKNLEQAVRLDKNNPDGYYWLGKNNLAQKDYETALANFRLAQKLDDQSFDIGEGLAQAYMGMGEFNNSYIVIIKVEGLAQSAGQKARFLYIRALSLDQLNQPEATYRDWNDLLAMPSTATTAEMRQKASERIKAMQTPVPSKTPTKTLTPVRLPGTLQPSNTPKPVDTRVPTSTPKP